MYLNGIDFIIGTSWLGSRFAGFSLPYLFVSLGILVIVSLILAVVIERALRFSNLITLGVLTPSVLGVVAINLTPGFRPAPYQVLPEAAFQYIMFASLVVGAILFVWGIVLKVRQIRMRRQNVDQLNVQ